MMPSAVYVGEYKSSQWLMTGEILQNVSWSGPPPAPSVKLIGYHQNINKASCPDYRLGGTAGIIHLRLLSLQRLNLTFLVHGWLL